MQQPFNRAAANEILRKLADSQPREGTYWHAAWVRDLLLMSWAFYHPNRIAELYCATWKIDNSGHVFTQAVGRWFYRNIHAGYASKIGAYELAQPAAEMLALYLACARAQLLKKESDLLLNMPSNHVNHRINTLIEKHFDRPVKFSELRKLQNG